MILDILVFSGALTFLALCVLAALSAWVAERIERARKRREFYEGILEQHKKE